jgi:putative hemolysin
VSSTIHRTGAHYDVAQHTPELHEVHGRYVLRFARSDEEIEEALRLRFEIFNVELGEGLEESHETGVDRDRFDDWCQHLVVFDRKRGRVIGTYRMQTVESARAGEGFYSATEFDLEGIPASVIDGTVELGRAAVSKEHRNRRVLHLLWRGLVAYLNHNKKRYFIGCCSLTSQDPVLAEATRRWLVECGFTEPALDVTALSGYECDAWQEDEVRATKIHIPTLFGIYLRYGVKMCGQPAIDRFFGTIDFLAFMDLERLDKRTLAALS